MRRKLDLALSLMAEPPILFLDEPTTGLDPVSRHALWDIIRDLVAGGTTVLLSTQYLNEADALADSVVFIDAGRVVATGTPAELKARAGQAQFDLIAASDADVVRLAAALGAFAVVTDAARRAVRVAVQGSGLEGTRELNAITGAATRAGARIEPGSYINFVLPGILVVAAAFAAVTTTISVAADMGEGVIDRFRTLPMAKSAVIAGHGAIIVVAFTLATVMFRRTASV
jgi:ABC-type proline/glycine betaine transport system ATPase subunit